VSASHPLQCVSPMSYAFLKINLDPKYQKDNPILAVIDVILIAA
jgi:hypothetical protein